jgi:HAD superfamily hydrolase (TIGR01509 family)
VLAAVLFDMDGTLVDSEKVWDVSLQRLADHLGGDLTPELRASLVGNSLGATISSLHAAFAVPASVDPATSAAYLLDETATLFREEIEWRPGAKELLAELDGAGVPMALVTATVRRLTDLVLDGIGHHWFAATVCGDEVEHQKPAPDPYRRAAELLGVDPVHCAAIEDSENGTRSALAARCAVLTVPCDAPVADGPGRHFVTSLTDVDLPALHRLVDAHVAGRA